MFGIHDMIVSFDLSISDLDYNSSNSMNYVNPPTKNLLYDSSNLVSRRHSNVNSFDKISSFSLLPQMNVGEIIRPNRVVNPNLHLYR